MPENAMLDAYACASRCDLFLMAVSALQVEPAASIPREAYKAGTKLVFINHTATPHDHLASVLFRENAGEVRTEIVEGLREDKGKESR